jgi:hypothetical protein
MGYPIFTWRPHMYPSSAPGGYRETILLSEDLTDLQVTPKRDVIDTYSIAGGRSRELLRAWLEVRIVLERFTDRALFRQFSAMINHLERGGHIQFSVDHQKVFNAHMTARHLQRETKLTHTSNLSESVSTVVCSTLADGDEIVIESGPPKAGREYHTATDHNYVGDTGIGRVTLGDSLHLLDSYAEGSHLRYSDYYPNLFLPSSGTGSALLTHDHRISYTLDLTLTYRIPDLNVASPAQPIEPISDGNDDAGDKPDWGKWG